MVRRTGLDMQARPLSTSASPNLLFDSDRTGNFEIYKISPTTGVVQLTNNATYDSWWPRLHPSGAYVLFMRAPAGLHDTDATQLSTWRVNIDGTGVTQLLAVGVDSWLLQAHPSWNPAGTKFVITGGAVDLYTVNADGTGRAKVTTTGQTFGLFDPAYSSDGTKIVYAYQPSGTDNQNLYTVPAAGGTPTALTSDASVSKKYYDPTYSPDDTKIAALVHTSSTALANWDIYLMNPNGSSPAALLADGNINSKPEWSPDGRNIYFHRNPGDGAGVFAVYSIPVAGGSLTVFNLGNNANINEYPVILR